MKTENKQQMFLIDVLKIFFAFCVVGIHTNVLEDLPNGVQWGIMQGIFRLAVPFYFVVSGFLLSQKLNGKLEKQEEILKIYRQKMKYPLLLWGGVGLVIYMVKLIIAGHDVVGIMLRVIRVAIFYPQGAMWFVAACIVGAYLLQFIIKNNWNYNIVDIYLKICLSARNGIFLFIYIWLGYLLSRANIRNFLNSNQKLVRGGGWLSSCTLILEIYYTYGKNVKDDSSLFVSFVVLIPLLVYKASNVQLKLNLPYKMIRELSTVTYYVHSAINQGLLFLFDFSGCIQFILVSIGCVYVFFISKKYHFKIY